MKNSNGQHDNSHHGAEKAGQAQNKYAFIAPKSASCSCGKKLFSKGDAIAMMAKQMKKDSDAGIGGMYQQNAYPCNAQGSIIPQQEEILYHNSSAPKPYAPCLAFIGGILQEGMFLPGPQGKKQFIPKKG